MNKQIHILLNSQSKEIESKNEILKDVENFYTNLYKSEGNDENQVRDNLTHVKKRISEEDCKSLNRPIQENEIQYAIKNIKNGKTELQNNFMTPFFSNVDVDEVTYGSTCKLKSSHSKRTASIHEIALLTITQISGGVI